jgi:hypothetical protein
VGGSGVGVSVTAGVGVSVETRSKASTRLGVLVGVGVTWLTRPDPQARMGVKLTSNPSHNIKYFLIKQNTSLLWIRLIIAQGGPVRPKHPTRR